MFQPLTSEDLADVLSKPPDKPKRTRKAKADTRELKVWYGLQHNLATQCENEHCLDPDAPKKQYTVTSVVNGKKMCRWCFLGGFNLRESSE